MRKTLYCFLLLLFFQAVLSQEKHRIGVTFGPNHFDLRGSYITDRQEPKMGGFVGVSYEYKIKENLSLITGIMYEFKNTEFQFDYSKDPYDENGSPMPTEHYSLRTLNQYSYITLPVLVRYKFGKNNSFFINGGIFISAKQKHEAKAKLTNHTKGTTENVNPYNNFPFADRFDKIDSGITLGFGKIFKISPKTELSLELRDYLGLTNLVSEVAGSQILRELNIKTNTLSLAATFSVGL